ncbi:nitronate monooxygenase [Virgibacillus sp. C22-A2]|uniref:Probable nitronate monooxygenase n=1 Tax=Virgibacillus tibetensis TaxID=3042313 RepID=A0ABU6KDA1_9BACI|nr:nitronate monooxygenase [Virgibacillus sp. C22-A2]
MSIQTAITRLFEIQYPIIQGGLQGIGRSPLVSKVSEAGGLGLITAGSFDTKKDMLDDIQATRRLTDKPFGINIAIGIRRPMDEFVEGAMEAEVPVVFTSGNNPEPFIDQLKSKGIKVVHVAPSIRFAKKAESLGCDAVVVNGYEGGGHPGKEDTTSLTIVQKAVKELSIPVIAAGGFSTGKSMLAALALGAEGVQMGTRFLLSKEAVLHNRVKKQLVSMQENGTILVKKSIGKTARVWKNEHSIELADIEEKGASLEEILPYINGESYTKLIRDGDLNSGIIALGQTVGLIDSIQSAEAIIQEIIADYEAQLKRLNDLQRKELV